MRNLSGSSAAGAAETAIKPQWLVELHFTAGTVRLSSRGAYTYQSNLFAAAGVVVTSESLRIYDDATLYSPLFLAQRTPVSVDIYEAFGNDPILNTAFDHVFSGEIGQRDIGDWISCQLRTITLRPEPHIYIQAPTFNFLPARDTVILTPTGTYQLPAPPTAANTPRPPVHYNSPTIPGWVPPVAPAGSINTQPELAEIQANFAAEGTVVPVHYGPFQFGGLPFAIAHASGTWTVGFVVGLGQIEAIDQVWINGAAPVSGVVVNSYLGTAVQTADALLAAAIPGYADALVHDDDGVDVGIAYIVIQYTNTHYPAFPSVIIEGRGRKVFDPETSTTGYSASPALALRDFVVSIMGEACNSAACTALKGACAATVGGEARRLVGITIDRAQPPEQWIEVLRTYASCYAWKRADTWHVLADRPGSVVKTLTASDVLRGTLRISLPDQSQTPTVVRCQFTDTSQDIWKSQEVFSEDSGVAVGSTPRINSAIRLPGVHRQSQATREVIERRKKLAKALRIEFEAFAEHADLEFGDIIEMSGFTRLPGVPKFRVVAPPRRTERGNVRIVATEYDETVYDDSAPTATPGGGVKVIGNTTLPASGQDGISVGISLSAATLFSQAPNGGAWSHTTCDATFTWRRGASVIATRVIRATLDTGTLLISLSSVSSSGEATSFTAPSAAAQVTATVSHTSTGTPNSIGFGRVQGGSQGSPGTASTAATANFGGQWGAFGDLVMRPNQGTGGADNGEILLEGAAGGSWVVYLGSSLTPRTGSRITLNTPWEGDVSAELGGRDNTFYVMEMATTASARWGGSFQALSVVTVTFEPTTRTWKAYADSVGSGTTFTPLTTDVIVGIGFKVSTTGGIDRLTSLMTAFKLTPATAGLFLDLLSVTGAMIADATITTGKIVSLEAGKISAGTINAVLALANQLQIATGGKLFMGKSAFATAAAGFFLGEDNGYAKFVVGNADGSKQIAWDGANFSINGGLINYGTNVVGDGKPDRYATRNGEGFFDDFGHGNSTTFDDEYYRFAGIGEAAIIDHSWNPSGGKALRLGNNSGNDEYDFVRKMEKAVPIRLNQVYMCRMLVARSAGSAVMYLGVAGVNRYKTEWVSSNGLNELSSQFYWGRSGSMPATTDFIEYVFWFKRTGGAVVNNYSSAVGGTNTPKNPSIIHANAHYACPILYTNYAGATGIVDVAFVEIRPYDPPEWNSNIVGQPSDSAILNSAAIVFDHQPVIAWMSFGTGSTAYSPTSSTQNATIKVRDGDGNIVASRTITATVTFSNGHISVPSDTVSGIQVSVSGNNTTYVTITITYGGKTSTMYALTSITAFGGVGK